MSNKFNGPSIEELMVLIQSDVHGYFFTIDFDSNTEIDYGRPTKKWRVRNRQTDEEVYFTVGNAVEIFTKYNIDFFHMHAELMHTIGITTISAQARIDRVKELLGEDKVTEIFEEWERFKEDLISTANNAVRRSRIKLV
jgi:hypothetical protein